MSERNFDIYEAVTDRIIAELESGVIPWAKPWMTISGGARKYLSGEPYSLLNQILLGDPGEYLSFKMCKDLGGSIRKGAKAKKVVFWKPLQYQVKDGAGIPMTTDDGEAVVKVIPYLKWSNVFHIDDCEGIESKVKDQAPLFDTPADERAEQVFSGYQERSGVGFESRKQNRAYYSPVEDKIVVPLIDQFADAAEYYSTLFHEATHSTGHESRLNRLNEEEGHAAFGSEEYSKEELVAEIGASAIMHEIGMESEKTFRNNAGYIQSWLKALREDKKLIVSAASRADKAVRMILNIQDPQPSEC